MASYITGIQQAGIGVANAREAKYLYKKLFGMNVLIFEDTAKASLMTRYTGGEIHERHAILSLNMAGGGGFEIWQFTSRIPQLPVRSPVPGDPGIFAIKIKSRNVKAAHRFFMQQEDCAVSALMPAPDGHFHFWVTDPYGNHFDLIEANDWFKKDNSVCGGVTGAVIGVSNMEKSIAFYRDMLGIGEIVYRYEATVTDMPFSYGQVFERVLLKKQVSGKGAFSNLLGAVQIELVAAKTTGSERIFSNRYWGDCGFIHLCFDVLDMDAMEAVLKQGGYPFSVDSKNAFSMGTAAGRFCYVEDPDGTLIELVETHRVPLLKKLGWHLNLQNRKTQKPLPGWMIGLMGLNRIR